MRKSARRLIALVVLVAALTMVLASSALAGPFGPITYMSKRSPYGPFGPVIYSVGDFDRLPTGVQLPFELRNLFW